MQRIKLWYLEKWLLVLPRIFRTQIGSFKPTLVLWMPSFLAKSILLSCLSPSSDYDYFATWCRWIWVTIFSVHLRLQKPTKAVRHDCRNERDYSKEHQEEKAGERNGWAPNLKCTDRSELRQREQGEVQIMVTRKPSQKLVLYAFYQRAYGSRNKWVGKVLSAVGFLCSVLIYIFRFTEHICFSNGMSEVVLKLGSDSIPQKCKLWGRFATGLKPCRHHDVSCCLWKRSLNTGKPAADLQSNQFLKWELICSEEGNASSSWIQTR